MTNDANCLFCKIITGDIPSAQVYADAEVIAFLDIRPTNPGHTLVVPRAHYATIDVLPAELWLAVARVTQRIAPSIMRATMSEGWNFIVNTGSAAGQIIPHMHVHIVPRLSSDGFRHWPGSDYASGEIERLAERLRGEISQVL